jgi:hypothetical protein
MGRTTARRVLAIGALLGLARCGDRAAEPSRAATTSGPNARWFEHVEQAEPDASASRGKDDIAVAAEPPNPSGVDRHKLERWHGRGTGGGPPAPYAMTPEDEGRILPSPELPTPETEDARDTGP